MGQDCNSDEYYSEVHGQCHSCSLCTVSKKDHYKCEDICKLLRTGSSGVVPVDTPVVLCVIIVVSVLFALVVYCAYLRIYTRIRRFSDARRCIEGLCASDNLLITERGHKNDTNCDLIKYKQLGSSYISPAHENMHDATYSRKNVSYKASDNQQNICNSQLSGRMSFTDSLLHSLPSLETGTELNNNETKIEIQVTNNIGTVHQDCTSSGMMAFTISSSCISDTPTINIDPPSDDAYQHDGLRPDSTGSGRLSYTSSLLQTPPKSKDIQPDGDNEHDPVTVVHEQRDSS